MASLDSNSMLTREQAAKTLTEYGYPITAGALATLATRGGGPPRVRFGKRVLYRWASLIDWASGRCTEIAGGNKQSAAA
jgi:hypothetical protein